MEGDSTPILADERGSRFLDAAGALLARIAESQGGALDRASRLCAAIGAGRLVHLFGSGHSRIPVEEMFPRYGSYPGFNPIVELSMTFHTQVVGANGQRQAMFIERTEGLAETILANFELEPPDVMVVFSVGGLTAVRSRSPRARVSAGCRWSPSPRWRIRCKELPATRRELACSTTPTSSSICTPPGDAMIQLDGLATPVGPGSTIAAVALASELKVRTAALLQQEERFHPS